MKINLKKAMQEDYVQVDVAEGTTLEALYRSLREEIPYPVLAGKVNYKMKSLTYPLTEPCNVELLDVRTPAVNLIYQNSLCVLYLKAIRDLMKTAKVHIQNSLNKGLYTEVRMPGPITDQQVGKVEARMRELVEADLPFGEAILNREESFAAFAELGLKEEARNLRGKPELQALRFHCLGGEKFFFYGISVPSTGYLKTFELRKYRDGVLLRFPQAANPLELAPYVDDKKMYAAFAEEARWQKLLDIGYVSDLNEKIAKGEIREVVQLSEALHDKKIVEIAQAIQREEKRIILIAGPSSSGKTTFARRLAIQLKVNGLKPIYLGTDDYFINREDMPLDKNGEKDFEGFDALEIDLFNKNMNALLAGEVVDIPEFDFIEGKKKFGNRITSIKHNQPIIVEGIHALNGRLTEQIPDRQIYKIYISPLTQLAIDEYNRIPTTDARIFRRMVRDYKYRGHDAQGTIKSWPKVRAGEDKNIFPYNGEADAFFNSAHIYELAVLKKYAEPLLKKIKETEPEYSEAVRLLKFLEFFNVLEEEQVIANNSIIREFIGGSVFVEE